MNNWIKDLPLIQETKTKGINLSRNECETTCMDHMFASFIGNSEIGKYPTQNNLREILAHEHEVEPQQILLGNGSTEVLNLICKAILNNNSFVRVEENSYGPLENIIKSFGAYITKFSFEARFLVNPDNPLGQFYNWKNEEFYINNNYLIVDEAYIDFYGNDESFLNAIEFYDNVIVTRTFSKIYGMAGLRVGYAVMSKNIAKDLSKVENRYAINTLSISMVENILKDYEFIYSRKKSFEDHRELANRLAQELGVRFYPACGNFITLEIPKVKGFTTRDLTHYSNMPGWKRVTLKNLDTTKLFFQSLKETLRNNS